MGTRRKDIDAAVDNERKRRMALLRSVSKADLLKVPEVQSEVVAILGKRISFTTFRESHDERLLILVRSDRPRFFGIVSYGATDGFWVLSDGTLAEVSAKDVLEFFG